MTHSPFSAIARHGLAHVGALALGYRHHLIGRSPVMSYAMDRLGDEPHPDEALTIVVEQDDLTVDGLLTLLERWSAREEGPLWTDAALETWVLGILIALAEAPVGRYDTFDIWWAMLDYPPALETCWRYGASSISPEEEMARLLEIKARGRIPEPTVRALAARLRDPKTPVPTTSFILELVEAWPGASEVVREGARRGDGRTIIYGALGRELARWLQRGGAEHELRQTLAIVDRHLSHTHEHEKDAIATGLLEALVHQAESDGTWSDLKALLGPEALAYVAAYDAFWGVS